MELYRECKILKQIIYFIAFLLLTTIATSCEKIIDFFFEDPPQNDLPYEEVGLIYIDNDTDQVLRLELNYGDSDMDDVHIASGCEAGVLKIDGDMRIHHIVTSYVYNEANEKEYLSGSENLITEDYIKKYIESLAEGSYLKIYNEDGELLCEWSKAGCHYAMKNLFDSSCYSYKMTNESAKRCLHVWRFTVTNDMLDIIQ